MDRDLRRMIGKSLQAVRKAAGFKSAKSFAEYVNMEVSRYTEYEQGRVGLPYETAWQLADALQCSMDELGGRVWPPEGSSTPIAPDERALVDRYRMMDQSNKERFSDLAGTFVIASEKDGPGNVEAENLAGFAAMM